MPGGAPDAEGDRHDRRRQRPRPSADHPTVRRHCVVIRSRHMARHDGRREAPSANHAPDDDDGSRSVTRDLVALDVPGGPRFVDALTRIWDRGDAAFPIDQRLPPPAKAEQLAALAVMVVHDADGTEHRLAGGRPVEDGDALVMATSGSTGVPKGVVLTHDAVAASARASSERLDVTDDDHWLACLPLSHVGGLAVVTRALLTATPLTVLAHFDADRVRVVRSDPRQPRRHGATADRPDPLPRHRARRRPTARGPPRQRGDHVRDDRDRQRRRLRRGATRRRRGHESPTTARSTSVGRCCCVPIAVPTTTSIRSPTAGWRPAISAGGSLMDASASTAAAAT